MATDAGGMEASTELSITIAGNTYPLRIVIGGSGRGEVDSSPAGIAGCGTAGGTCEATFLDGATVTLTAHPDPGSTFSGWSGGGCPGTGSCRVTLGGDTTVTATFDAGTAGAGGGRAGPPPPSAPTPRHAPRPARPDTKILGVRVDSAGGRATFRFRSIGATDSFRCSLKRPGEKAGFSSCRSPRTYRHLALGRYLFSVRAVGPGGADQTPATRRLRIGRRRG